MNERSVRIAECLQNPLPYRWAVRMSNHRVARKGQLQSASNKRIGSIYQSDFNLLWKSIKDCFQVCMFTPILQGDFYGLSQKTQRNWSQNRLPPVIPPLNPLLVQWFSKAGRKEGLPVPCQLLLVRPSQLDRMHFLWVAVRLWLTVCLLSDPLFDPTQIPLLNLCSALHQTSPALYKISIVSYRTIFFQLQKYIPGLLVRLARWSGRKLDWAQKAGWLYISLNFLGRPRLHNFSR